LVPGVKSGKVQRCIGAEIHFYPARKLTHFFGLIVQRWNNQVCYFEMYICGLGKNKNVLHGFQRRRADITIEFLGNSLQIDVRRIDLAEQLLPRLFICIPGRNEDVSYPGLVCQLRAIICVLVIDNRICIGICY